MGEVLTCPRCGRTGDGPQMTVEETGRTEDAVILTTTFVYCPCLGYGEDEVGEIVKEYLRETFGRMMVRVGREIEMRRLEDKDV